MNPKRIIAINRAFYRENIARYSLQAESVRLTPIYDFFLSGLPSGARILDAGCGTGRDSLEFIRRGCQVVAIDSSAEMVAYCRQRGVDARLKTFEAMGVQRAFDGIWASASLLHISRRQITRILKILSRTLRPDGKIFISLKEGAGEGLAADGRYASFYSFGEFRALLRSLPGIEVVHGWRSAKAKAVAETPWIGFVAKKMSGRSRRIGPKITGSVRQLRRQMPV